MVFRNECLHIVGKVVYYDQYVLHYRLLVCCYGDFHSDIIDVDQFHRLSADDRLHQWKLALCLVLNTPATVGYSSQQGLDIPGHQNRSFIKLKVRSRP